jgi:UDP-3-O-[3-hydroxymyristoyl] glucosamine N-acyltransferase
LSNEIYSRTNSGILEGEVVGDPNAEVHELSKIEGKIGSLTFLSNPKYNAFIYIENTITIVNEL